MKVYLTLTGIALACLLVSCGKSDTVTPEKPGTENPNPNPDDNNPKPKALLSNDPSFKVPTGFISYHVFTQPDGKILIDSYSTVNSQIVVKILRLNTDGTLDNSFNIDVDKSWMLKGVSGIFVLGDGKVLLCGEFTVNGQRAVLVRLTSTGALDKSYVHPSVGGPIRMQFQRAANGKVLFATTHKISTIYDYIQARLFRLNSDGSLDESFVVNSYDVAGTADEFSSMVPLADGKTIIAGIFSIGTDDNKRKNIARINADGSADFTFNFKEVFNAERYATKIAVQSDGKIVMAGGFNLITDPNIRDANYAYIGMARLNPNGDIDHSFSAPSKFIWGNYMSDLTTLSDNRILAHWRIVANNNDNLKSNLLLSGANGGIDNSYSFQYQNSKIAMVFRQSPDNFLLVGEILVDGTTYPIIRLKK